MEKKDKVKGNNDRRRLVPALLLVLLITAAFFVLSDVSFVKNARDSLMQKLGYEAVDQGDGNENGNGEDGGSESSGVKTAEWDITSDIDPSALPEMRCTGNP